MLHEDSCSINQCERTLVSLAKSGDEAAFGELVSRCYPSCKRLAASILHDLAEAEDVTQICCVTAHRALHHFREECSFATWLGRIVVNKARCVLRLRRRHTMVSIDEALPLPSRAYSQSDAFLRDPEQQMSTRQGCIILSREIALIPPIFRNILILRELREIPLREIASQLKLTVPTVKSRLFRGRKELRARLLKCCGARDLLAS